MTKEELQIGDWVNNDINCMPEKVNEIGSGLVMLEYNDLYKYDEISPIPLTDGILKENGFEYHHKNYASLSYEHPFQLKMKEWPDENGLGGLWTISDIIEIRYVHQLQHALRLCGIDKEIILKFSIS